MITKYNDSDLNVGKDLSVENHTLVFFFKMCLMKIEIRNKAITFFYSIGTFCFY